MMTDYDFQHWKRATFVWRRSDIALYGILMRWEHVVAGYIAICPWILIFEFAYLCFFSFIKSNSSLYILNHMQSDRRVPRQTFPNRKRHSHLFWEEHIHTILTDSNQTLIIYTELQLLPLEPSKVRSCYMARRPKTAKPSTHNNDGVRFEWFYRADILCPSTGLGKSKNSWVDGTASCRWRRNRDPAHWIL